MRFFPRVAVISGGGGVIRFIPGPLAQKMVEGGFAEIRDTRGRVREVVLLTPASTHAERIGEPTGPHFGVRFYRWTRLDESATRIVEHHPRCTYA